MTVNTAGHRAILSILVSEAKKNYHEDRTMKKKLVLFLISLTVVFCGACGEDESTTSDATDSTQRDQSPGKDAETDTSAAVDILPDGDQPPADVATDIGPDTTAMECPPGSHYEGDVCVLNPVGEWTYLGIPYPSDWPFDPFLSTRPADPASWPSAAAENFYHVAPDDPAATDDAEAGEPVGEHGRYGYPDRPRASFPSSGWIGDVFPAGTVIVMRGGTYTSANFYGAYSPQLQGTPEAPVWIAGDPQDPPRFTDVAIQLYASHYFVLEHLHWIGGNTRNGALSLTRDRDGATHHAVLRHLRFEDMDWVAGGGAIVGVTAGSNVGAEVHDVVAYQNVFQNCGGGYDWSTVDNDHHGYKIDGLIDGNNAYRVWVIENQALPGAEPDPVDGLYKSLSGNLVQVGDQRLDSGGVHHIYVAGNFQRDARQALAWTKRSTDVIFSGNTCDHVYAMAGGNGQCFGSQYDARWHWALGNTAQNAYAGWQHTSNDETPGPYFIYGNTFHDMTLAAPEGWRRNAGVTLWNARGAHYVVNNTMYNMDHGIWADTNRVDATSSLHVHNNIIAGLTGSDPAGALINVDPNNPSWISHNLFDVFSLVEGNGSTFTSLDALNASSNATGNLVGDPAFVDVSGGDFSLSPGSTAIGAATTSPPGAADVRQQFIDRYSNDPNFPQDPATVFPPHGDLGAP